MNHKKQNEHSPLTLKWNNSEIDYPGLNCIHELFEEQVKKTPDATAIVFKEEALSYNELNARANQLAHYLCSIGVKNEALVPLCMARSIEMIVGILGILKAGAAYAIIDPNYQLERIAHILNDTGAFLVVCNKQSKIHLKRACRAKNARAFLNTGNRNYDLLLGAFKSIDLVELNRGGSFLKNQPTDNLNIELSPENAAYVIYSSGAPGRPKRVITEHGALATHCHKIIEADNLRTCKSFALFSPLGFDTAHHIIHSSLILGASLHVLSDEIIINGERAANYVERVEKEQKAYPLRIESGETEITSPQIDLVRQAAVLAGEAKANRSKSILSILAAKIFNRKSVKPFIKTLSKY